MTKQEYHALLTSITAKKIQLEAEDAALEKQINNCLLLLKNGANQTTQAEMDRCKKRRFDGLNQERKELCEGFIGEMTGFSGDMLPIYTEAERQGLKGERWARFMLEHCGCSEPK